MILYDREVNRLSTLLSLALVSETIMVGNMDHSIRALVSTKHKNYKMFKSL